MDIDFSVYLAMLRRRWLVILAPIVLLTPLAVGVAYILPPVYESTARILVDPAAIPSQLAQSTVTTNAAQRVAFIEQQLMTRQNLLSIAERFGVYENRPDLSPSDIVDLMRGATRISSRGGRVSSVEVSFKANNARIASQVANEFVSRLLRQNIEVRNASAFETSAYFRQEVARLSSEIDRLSVAITEFKIANQDALPNSLDFRRRETSELERRIFEREKSLRELEQQRERFVAAVAAGEIDFAQIGASPEAQELNRLRRQLAVQRATFAEAHPTIRSLTSRISALEAALSTSDDPNGGDTSRQVEAALARIDERIAEIEERLAFERGRVEELNASIARTPSVELELNSLERELRTVQTQHNDAVLKLARAETGERLEVNQQAERLEVIEQPQTPTAPISPNRPLIAAAGMVGSVGLGFGLAILLELLNPALRTAADVERRLEMAPIVVIPYIATRREEMWRRWRWRVAFVAVFILIPTALFLIDQYYLPLPVLAQRLIEMTGLDGAISLVRMRLGQ